MLRSAAFCCLRTATLYARMSFEERIAPPVAAGQYEHPDAERDLDLDSEHYRICSSCDALAETVERQADAGDHEDEEADVDEHPELGGGVTIDFAAFVLRSAEGRSEDEQIEYRASDPCDGCRQMYPPDDEEKHVVWRQWRTPGCYQVAVMQPYMRILVCFLIPRNRRG